jgi:hypothetical protein
MLETSISVAPTAAETSESSDWDEIDALLSLDTNAVSNNDIGCDANKQHEIDLEIDAIFDEIVQEQNELRKRVLEAQEKLKSTTEAARIDAELHKRSAESSQEETGAPLMEEKIEDPKIKESKPQNKSIPENKEVSLGAVMSVAAVEQPGRNPQSSEQQLVQTQTKKQTHKKNSKKKFSSSIEEKAPTQRVDKTSSESTVINGDSLSTARASSSASIPCVWIILLLFFLAIFIGAFLFSAQRGNLTHLSPIADLQTSPSATHSLDMPSEGDEGNTLVRPETSPDLPFETIHSGSEELPLSSGLSEECSEPIHESMEKPHFDETAADHEMNLFEEVPIDSLQSDSVNPISDSEGSLHGDATPLLQDELIELSNDDAEAELHEAPTVETPVSEAEDPTKPLATKEQEQEPLPMYLSLPSEAVESLSPETPDHSPDSSVDDEAPLGAKDDDSQGEVIPEEEEEEEEKEESWIFIDHPISLSEDEEEDSVLCDNDPPSFEEAEEAKGEMDRIPASVDSEQDEEIKKEEKVAQVDKYSSSPPHTAALFALVTGLSLLLLISLCSKNSSSFDSIPATASVISEELPLPLPSSISVQVSAAETPKVVPKLGSLLGDSEQTPDTTVVSPDGSRGVIRMKREGGNDFENSYQRLRKEIRRHPPPPPLSRPRPAIPLPILSSSSSGHTPRSLSSASSSSYLSPFPAMSLQEGMACSVAAKGLPFQE